MDLASSSGLLLTTSEDGYARQGEVIEYIVVFLYGLLLTISEDGYWLSQAGRGHRVQC